MPTCIQYLIGSAILLINGDLATQPVIASRISTVPVGNTIESRIAAPAGFYRVQAAPGSFAAYLRALPLKPSGAKVHYFDGQQKYNDVYVAVVDLDVGKRDLQQCADAVMRLRAEWLWSQNRKDEISFRFTDGFHADYKNWRDGKRVGTRNDHAFWKTGSRADSSYGSFRQYLDVVFTYASTISLEQSLKTRLSKDLATGDVFIRGGSPGHAVIVVDMVQNDRGEKRFLLAQSYMPAQDIQVLKNYSAPDLSPWYSGHINGLLQTPEWDFKERELRTW
jgi:hypothetical protein